MTASLSITDLARSGSAGAPGSTRLHLKGDLFLRLHHGMLLEKPPDRRDSALPLSEHQVSSTLDGKQFRAGDLLRQGARVLVRRHRIVTRIQYQRRCGDLRERVARVDLRV